MAATQELLGLINNLNRDIAKTYNSGLQQDDLVDTLNKQREAAPDPVAKAIFDSASSSIRAAQDSGGDGSINAATANEVLLSQYYKDPSTASVLAKYDPTFTRASAIRTQLENQAANTGVVLGNKAQSSKMHTNILSVELAKRGVEDLRNIKVSGSDLVDRASGKKIDFKGAATGMGEGWTNYKFAAAGDVPVFYTQWEDSSDTRKIAPLAALGLNFVLPGLGAGIGAALGATGAAASAIGAGVISGGISALGGGSGSDIFKSALSGGVGSYIGSFAPGISKAVGGGTLGNIVGKGITGVASAALTGSDPVRALLLSSLNGVDIGAKLGLDPVKAASVNRLVSSYAKYRLPRKS